MISHPSTDQAWPCLAYKIRRDQACAGWHGGRQADGTLKVYLVYLRDHCSPWEKEVQSKRERNQRESPKYLLPVSLYNPTTHHEPQPGKLQKIRKPGQMSWALLFQMSELKVEQISLS